MGRQAETLYTPEFLIFLIDLFDQTIKKSIFFIHIVLMVENLSCLRSSVCIFELLMQSELKKKKTIVTRIKHNCHSISLHHFSVLLIILMHLHISCCFSHSFSILYNSINIVFIYKMRVLLFLRAIEHMTFEPIEHMTVFSTTL